MLGGSKARMGFLQGHQLIHLHQFFEQSVVTYPDNIALICDNAFISYYELDCRANQLANYLSQQDIKKGSIVGILLERSIESYISILAVLKLGATYVPIETEFPDDRVEAIFSDLPFQAVITSSLQVSRRKSCWPKPIVMDKISSKLSSFNTSKPNVLLDAGDEDGLCYIIYTSGSTGKPKGVEITHKSICHYVSVASELYVISHEDRVYQGFSLAFDASLEEMWMALANGAALIACTSKEVRSGLGLISFLKQHRVSVFSTVPTLLSNIEGSLPDLRLLILGGEACTAGLVKRWSSAHLRILNTYGPTEATVVATYAECHPDQDITIGKPLPGYEVLVVNDGLCEVIDGQIGELCIAGPALARGYVNRPENTAEKFVINPNNINQRLYRTGDLVQKNSEGNLQFCGRVDDQVKLRGFRIELNEIEAVMMEYTGVNQAVVCLQHLEKPTLVAYVLADKKNSFDLESLKIFLRTKLPDFMMPTLIELVSVFPLLSSGKVDRKKLPKPTASLSRPYQAPKNQLEKDIATVWEEAFACEPISVDADFFYDLGGHSLFAAKVISSLRTIPYLKNISILDLYKNPSISKLAEHCRAQGQHQSTTEDAPRVQYKAPWWKYYLCGAGQFFGCLFQYAFGTWQLLAVVLCYTWISAQYSIISRESQLTFLGLFLSMPLISLAITVGMKWLLLGRVKPGVYPLWGWFYFRWWMVQRLLKNVYLGKYLTGSPLAIIYYRLLGAKIGKNCHIATTQILTHDLITIGDNTTIGSDSRLNGYIVEDGWLKIGSIAIGSDCSIGARTVVGVNASIKNHAVLEDMSMIPDNGVLPHGEYYVGSPAVSTPIPEHHITKNSVGAQASSMVENTAFGILHYLGIVLITLMYYFSMIPSISLVTYFYEKGSYFTTMLFAVPLGAVLFLGLHYICIILCKKLLMNKVVPGRYPVKSFYYLRHWIMFKMLDEDELYIMADSLYYPMFLRLLGAKLGRGVEMGETPHITPDLVTIEEGGFTASSVALAWPSVHKGMVTFAPVTIGKKGFAGNVSFVPGGASIGDGGLLGGLSITPSDNQSAQAHTSWLGSPAVFLPNREVFTGFSDKETYHPPKKLYITRLLIEFVRILLPSTFSLLVLFNLLYVLDYMVANYSWTMAALVLPGSELLFTLTLIGVLVGMKWLLLGKLKPLTKPIWNIFIWKNDLVEYSYNYFINPRFNNKVLGTPFALIIPRCLGTKAGKRVFTDSAEFSEFDLITIGDDVCINAETIIQTHLYEDRIFKVAHATIQSGCNIGVGSIVLYNTLMEPGSTLGSLSLLMKGERLPENTQWAGIPAQSTHLTTNPYPMQPQAEAASVVGAREVISEL
jgi:non-ribosomal peptide synthetase-like protein